MLNDSVHCFDEVPGIELTRLPLSMHEIRLNLVKGRQQGFDQFLWQCTGEAAPNGPLFWTASFT